MVFMTIIELIVNQFFFLIIQSCIVSEMKKYIQTSIKGQITVSLKNPALTFLWGCVIFAIVKWIHGKSQDVFNDTVFTCYTKLHKSACKLSPEWIWVKR